MRWELSTIAPWTHDPTWRKACTVGGTGAQTDSGRCQETVVPSSLNSSRGLVLQRPLRLARRGGGEVQNALQAGATDISSVRVFCAVLVL